jgi:hypothetical protein
MGNLSRLIIQGSTVLMMVLMGCSEQGGSPSASGSSSAPTPDVEPDPILQSASTFDELVIEDGFTFDMQRTVNIDLSFSQKQGFTEI